jgi:hypothetical protein
MRSRAMRKIFNYAAKYPTAEGVERFDPLLTNVVYIVFHCATSNFYIGQTKHTALTRLKQHFADRKRPETASTLTQFMSNRQESEWSNVLIMPLRQGFRTDTERMLAEGDAIAALRVGACGHCLNKLVPGKGRRLRHRPVPMGPPSREPQHEQRRDLQGTLTHVTSLATTNRFEALGRMSVRKLRSLKSMMLDNAPFKTVLKDVIEHKTKERKPAAERNVAFVASFTSKKYDKSGLGSVLRGSTDDWPFDKRFLTDTRVTYKMNVEAGGHFRNHQAVSLALNLADLPTTCGCATVDAKYKVNGHVLTTETDVFLDMIQESERGAVKTLIEIDGSKFRFSLKDTEALSKLRKDLCRFYECCGLRQAQRDKSDKAAVLDNVEDKNHWVNKVYHRVVERVYGTHEAKTISRIPLKTVMEDIHKIYVIGPVDKNPQKSVIWCRKLYCDTLAANIAKGFQPDDATPKEVFDFHDQAIKKFGFKAHPCFPYPYALAKCHKFKEAKSTGIDPSRVIVGKSKSNTVSGEPYEKGGVNSLTELGAHTTNALNSVVDLLLLQDAKEEIKRCWICRSTQDFIDSASNVNCKEMTTADFEKLYTNLQLDEVIDGVHFAIDRAAQELKRRFATTSLDKIYFSEKGTWIYEDKKSNKRHWNIATLKEAVTLLVRNSFLKVGDKMYRQTLGIGMGHEPCPLFANLYLFAKECRWIDYTIQMYGKEVVARTYDNFRGFQRYIDDLFANVLSHQLPGADCYGDLTLKITGEGRQVDFIGVRCQQGNEEGRVCFKVQDKQKNFEFNLIRYPSANSTVPKCISIGCIVGALSRAASCTTQLTDFIEEATGQMRIFVKRGYNESTLKAGIWKFAKRQIEPLHRHIFATTLINNLYKDVTIEPSHTAAPPPASSAATQPEAAPPPPPLPPPDSGHVIVWDLTEPPEETSPAATPTFGIARRAERNPRGAQHRRRVIVSRTKVVVQQPLPAPPAQAAAKTMVTRDTSTEEILMLLDSVPDPAPPVPPPPPITDTETQPSSTQRMVDAVIQEMRCRSQETTELIASVTRAHADTIRLVESNTAAGTEAQNALVMAVMAQREPNNHVATLMESFKHAADAHTRATYEQATAYMTQQSHFFSSILEKHSADQIEWHRVRASETEALTAAISYQQQSVLAICQQQPAAPQLTAIMEASAAVLMTMNRTLLEPRPAAPLAAPEPIRITLENKSVFPTIEELVHVVEATANARSQSRVQRSCHREPSPAYEEAVVLRSASRSPAPRKPTKEGSTARKPGTKHRSEGQVVEFSIPPANRDEAATDVERPIDKL